MVGSTQPEQIVESLVSPWIADLIKTIVGVVFGWALGFGSALLVEWRNKKKRVHAIRVAISQELRELAWRLAFTAYAVECKQGGLNRQFLEWMKKQCERYAGPNTASETLVAVNGLLKGSDADLSAAAAHMKERRPRSFFPREEASYTTSAVGQVHDFPPEYGVRLLDILSHLRMYNEIRENGLYYFRLTFSEGISPENQTKAFHNVDLSDRKLAERARIIVDKITELERHRNS